MADSFGIPQVVEYLGQMGLKIARVEQERELIELAFHGNQGQWRLIIGIQQRREVRKLMLIVPHIGVVTAKKRLECLEALMAVNYRIAMGKFGLDLDDGEIRLEETIALANDQITFEQFQLVFGAMIQTVSIYHSLLPRIVYGNLSVQEALQACEADFFEGPEESSSSIGSAGEGLARKGQAEQPAELDVNDVLAEVRRLLEEPKDK